MTKPQLTRAEFSIYGEECCTIEHAYEYAADLSRELAQRITVLESQVLSSSRLVTEDDQISRALLVRCRNTLSRDAAWLSESASTASRLRLYHELQSFLDRTGTIGFTTSEI